MKNYIITNELGHIIGTRFDDESKAKDGWIEVQSPVYDIWDKDGNPIKVYENGEVKIRPGYENAELPFGRTL